MCLVPTSGRDRQLFRIPGLIRERVGGRVRHLQFVQLISLGERRQRDCSLEKAEVELEHGQRELRHRIAWRSERLASGAALTAQIPPEGRSVFARSEQTPTAHLYESGNSRAGVNEIEPILLRFVQRDNANTGEARARNPWRSISLAPRRLAPLFGRIRKSGAW